MKTYTHDPFLQQSRQYRNVYNEISGLTGTPCLALINRSVLNTPVSGSTDRDKVSILNTCVAYGFGYLRQNPMVVVDHGYWYWISFWNSLTILV